MYVDHMSTGVETSTQADEQYKEAKTLFQSASINLREWASNSSKFLENGPECDRTSAETMKVLGTSCNLQFFFHQWISPSLLRSDHKKRGIAACQQNLRSIGSLFSSHSECKTIHPGTVETTKRLGRDVQSITSTRMEQDWGEPDSTVLSANTQIYWRRQIQTFLLHRCLCQSLFSSSIPLLVSKWKNNCQSGVFQSTHCASKTTHHYKIETARGSYRNEMP